MNNNLNQNLYSRFGLQLNLEQVQSGCKKHFEELILTELRPIVSPSVYKDATNLWEIHTAVFKELCRQLFLSTSDFEDFMNHQTLKNLIVRQISGGFKGSFSEYLLRLQILLNIVGEYKLVSFELDQLAEKIEKHLQDFPVLGITIKRYKKKAPQILPSTSKKFEDEVKNTLGLLEVDKKYEHVLSHFENGLKELLFAKTKAEYKDVIEDMYTACDELVKAVLGNKQKGFRHIADKTEAASLKLNGHQKELYKNLRNWLDEIKHGSLKDFDRVDTEMIISMTGSLIRFVISK